MADSGLVYSSAQRFYKVVNAHPLAAEDFHHLLSRFIGKRFGKGNYFGHIWNYIDIYQYVKRAISQFMLALLDLSDARDVRRSIHLTIYHLDISFRYIT